MIDTSPPEPDPVRPGRRRLWWTAGVTAVVVLAVAAVIVTAWPSHPTPSAAATTASASPVVIDVPAALPRPSASAPTSDWQLWVGQEAGAAMRRQTAALLSGDLTGYLAIGVPAAKTQLGQRFRSLRSLRVTRFDQHVDGSPWPPARPGGDWRAVTIADNCFVEKDCAADAAVFDSMWRVTPQGVSLTGFRVHDRASPCFHCPAGTETVTRPWETTELTAQVGQRTLVAVPLVYRNRLAELSRRAEAAAAVADRYTVGEGRVDRYRVFVADPASWKLWYAGFPGTWVAGRAVATGQNRIETEVLASQLTPAYADELMRHELAHVSTLRNNSFYGQDDVWWLVEGMAEYAKQDGDAAGAAQERHDLNRFLRTHKLPSVALSPPTRKASVADAAGRYAVGYFALQHLIAKYGHAATLAFFEQAVQDGLGLQTAAQSALGKPWAQLNSECAAAVRKA